MNLTDFSGQRPDFFGQKLRSTERLAHIRTLGGLELLGLRSPSNTACKPPEGNNAFVVFHVTEISICLDKLKAFDHLG